jgi:hypothetical protein
MSNRNNEAKAQSSIKIQVWSSCLNYQAREIFNTQATTKDAMAIAKTRTQVVIEALIYTSSVNHGVVEPITHTE